jgi:GT2 family glycosyltransferase
MHAPKVSIVIPVFNQWSYTEKCLSALRANTKETPIEIIVVNNASTDETSRQLAVMCSEWKELRTITLDSNTGFSPACNVGAEASRAPLLLFLNNDTEVHAGWLPPLLAELCDPAVGIVAPKLVNPGGRTINHAGYVFGAGAFYGIYSEHPADHPSVNKKRDYQALLGACILMSRELFLDVGCFSLEGLEDIDLCLKVRRRGLTCRYLPESVVTHVGSVTLANSALGALPVTEVAHFGQRWNTEDVQWDDFRWLIEDEELPAPQASEGRTPLEQAEQSIGALLAAYVYHRKGDVQMALECVELSLALWRYNSNAFFLWCILMIELDRVNEVRQTLLTPQPDFSFHALCAREILPYLDRIPPL